MGVKNIAEEAINKNKIVVFSKSWCPYCAKAKQSIRDFPGIHERDVKILELDKIEDGHEIQEYLQEKTNQRTVPNIFISQIHIGGSDDLQKAIHNGKVKELLAK